MSSVRGMTAAMDPPRVLTVQPAEFSRLTGWFPCGKRTNGRGGLGQFIVASIFVSRARDTMVTAVQIMAHLVLSVMMSFCGIIKWFINQ